MNPHLAKILVAVLLSTTGCLLKQMREIRSTLDDLEESRSPDARSGVLMNEVPPATQARLELLGRTSAPTRYAERTDANRIRVVAFDFGGTYLGQCADLAGNLIARTCRRTNGETYWPEGNPISPSGDRTSTAPKVELRAGMFRQYSTQVGTTVEADLGVASVGTEGRYFFSHNLMILEWRRYELQYMNPGDARGYNRYNPPESEDSHVSAIELGIAIRVIFDVRLNTTDIKLSASFGIANLTTALARNEASVEVSYEIVGTTLDLLPKEPVIITSLNEYNDALDDFYAAVKDVATAWDAYRRPVTNGPATIKIGDVNMIIGPKDFGLAQLAYYVDGAGVGDTFSHLEKVDTCEAIGVFEREYSKQLKLKKLKIQSLYDQGGGKRARKVLARELEKRQKRIEKKIDLSRPSTSDNATETLKVANEALIKSRSHLNTLEDTYATSVSNMTVASQKRAVLEITRANVETITLLENEKERLEDENKSLLARSTRDEATVDRNKLVIKNLGTQITNKIEEIPDYDPDTTADTTESGINKLRETEEKARRNNEITRARLARAREDYERNTRSVDRLEGTGLEKSLALTKARLDAVKAGGQNPSTKTNKQLKRGLRKEEAELTKIEQKLDALDIRSLGLGCERVHDADNLRKLRACSRTCDDGVWLRLSCDQVINNVTTAQAAQTKMTGPALRTKVLVAQEKFCRQKPKIQ